MNLVNIEIFGYQCLFYDKKKQASDTGRLTFFDLILGTKDLDLPGCSGAEKAFCIGLTISLKFYEQF